MTKPQMIIVSCGFEKGKFTTGKPFWKLSVLLSSKDWKTWGKPRWISAAYAFHQATGTVNVTVQPVATYRTGILAVEERKNGDVRFRVTIKIGTEKWFSELSTGKRPRRIKTRCPIMGDLHLLDFEWPDEPPPKPKPKPPAPVKPTPKQSSYISDDERMAKLEKRVDALLARLEASDDHPW